MSGPILVFGAGGQLGREVLARGAARKESVVGVTRAEADITDADAIAQVIGRAKPRLILNAAAYTAVDRAESEPEAAAAINATGAGLLAQAAADAAVPLIHISTDYVFDGTKSGAYVEGDPVAPQNVYGRTKAEGEALVCAKAQRAIVLRTSWVYGRYGANFLKTILRLACERDDLPIVADQHGCPTSTADLAEAVFVIDRCVTAAGSVAPWGLYHFAGTGATSWHGFAEAIIDAQARSTQRRPTLSAIATADYPTPARRPANSVLDSARFTATFGYAAAPWQARVRDTVAALLAPAEAR